ncbi:hypothetical protein NE237_014851 [Protea cynaroides]|uniref:UBC core domain-containing protein n=1 Tax=Protea cynaroides TaxID=273540 RepID=A0A9Q0KCW9_9MAGN|nr:hypothetical protein NE237_014851 [Protea cynaroides]
MELLSRLLNGSSSKSSSKSSSAAVAMVSNPGVKNASDNARKRLQKELGKITRDPPSHCSYGLVKNDIFKGQGAIMGPADTPFEGGIFFLCLFPQGYYPFKPPKVRFLTKVYHPDIDANGNIHVDILQEVWSPSLILTSFYCPCALFFLIQMQMAL